MILLPVEIIVCSDLFEGHVSDVNVEGEVIFGKLSTLSRKDQMQRCALSDPESRLDRDLIRVRVGI